MKPLLKIMIVLGLFFTSTFVVLKFSGVVTVERIQGWIEAARDTDPFYAAAVVVGLLFVDLFVFVPTLTVTLLSGYFLGPVHGALAAYLGMLLAGSTGYGISRKCGDRLIHFLIRDAADRADAIATFRQHGPLVILLSRAVPVLPEVSSCMSGMTRMPLAKFLVLWTASAAPYAAIAAYAGSASSLDDPMPAIFTAVGLTSFFWLCGFVLRRRTLTAAAASEPAGDR